MWGLVVFREYAGSDVRVKTLLGTMLILYVLGVGIVAAAG
ncbi:MAG: hypothetical protein ACRD96_10340 [Bryobacteraceae bacterium]